MEQKIKQSIHCYLRILTCALHMPQFCSSIPCQHGWIRLLLQFHNSINAVIESGDFGHSSLEVQVAINQQVKTLLKPAPSLWLTCNFTTVDGSEISEILQCIKPVEIMVGTLPLFGGFNPSEKYARQNGFIFPNIFGWKFSKNIWVATTRGVCRIARTINVVCQPMGWKARPPPPGASSESDRLDPDDRDRFIGDPLKVPQVQCILWNPYTKKQP